ncbi:MAG: hypothetical protein PHT69_01805 [Bacteroidales bacterium]|nr:hypothetical protein [Bacteroidales bacterium]
MKKLLVIFTFFLLHGFIAMSQAVERETFVILNDGTIKYHDNIWLKNYGVFSNSENKEIYPYDDFKFVYTENGFFANTSKVRKRKAPYIAKRTISGEVNMFESQIITVNSSYVSGASEGSLLRPKSYFNYYNTGVNDILPINYDNLNVLFSTNAESIDFLEQSRKAHSIGKTFRIASSALIYTGSALFLYNMFLVRNRSFQTNQTDFFKPFIFSVSIALTGSLVGLGKNVYYAKANEYLREAFITYNGIE